jgi:hypothetical protein
VVFKVKCKECDNQATIHVSTGINASQKSKSLKEKQGFFCAEHDPFKQHPQRARQAMKPTYDEVVEKVARAMCLQCLKDEHIFINGAKAEDFVDDNIQDFIWDAKIAIRAMQDMMPDYEEGKPLLEKLSNEALFYQHFKTIGR